jgi:hypothetical protein
VRIEQGVEQIDKETDANKKHGGNKHLHLDKRVVAVVEPLDGQTADAWPDKHGFGHHGCHEPVLLSPSPQGPV